MLLPYALLLWMIVGLLALTSIPAARGNNELGATLPFWLVIAPALDLIWLSRRRIVRIARAYIRSPLKETLHQARRTHRAASSRTPAAHFHRRNNGIAVAATVGAARLADQDRPGRHP